MRKLPSFFYITLVITLSLVLFSNCKTEPESKPGLYVNKEFHFSVTYPKEWEEKQLLLSEFGEVLRVSPSEKRFPVLTVYIGDISENVIALNDIPKWQPVWLKSLFPKTTGHKLVHEKMIKLEDGTLAVEFDIKWNLDESKTKLISTILELYKNDRHFSLWCTGKQDMSIEEIEEMKRITHSIKFY